MADYRLSRRAAADLEAIANHTIRSFGLEQARRYRDELGSCLTNLAENPNLGRRVDQLAPRLRRFEHGSHIIFYQPKDDGVFVVRVLHQRMDVSRHF